MISDSILQTFIEEATDTIKRVVDYLDLLISELEDPSDEVINHIFQGIHTIKGNSLFLKFDKISQLSESMEEIIAKILDGRLSLTQKVMDMLYQGADTLSLMIEDPEESENQDIEDIKKQMQQVKTMLKNESSVAETPFDAQILKSDQKIFQPEEESNQDDIQRHNKQKEKYMINGINLDKVRNHNEIRVIKEMKRVIPEYPRFDGCRVCTEDVYALVMNNIAPVYSQVGTIVFRHAVSVELIREEIVKALKVVIAKPTHIKNV